MLRSFFVSITEEDKSRAVEKLVASGAPSRDFFLMLTLSVLLAAFGLHLDSAAVIIGSMLIAPILYPMLSLALGISISDFALVSRSVTTIAKAVLLSVFAASAVTIFFAPRSELGPEILSRIEPSLLFLSIGIVAGFAASFALVKRELNETLPGVAISVALIPPLAVVGIGLARLDWAIISGSLLLFAINAIGVIFAGLITFSLMNFYVERRVAEQLIKAEEEKKKLEKAKAEYRRETEGS